MIILALYSITFFWYSACVSETHIFRQVLVDADKQRLIVVQLNYGYALISSTYGESVQCGG